MPMTDRTRWRRSVNPSARNSPAAFSRVRSERRRASSTPTSAADTRMPRPPSWVSTMMVSWPRNVQCVAVSTELSPVVVTADAAVNSASTNVVERPRIVIPGRSSSSVPAVMAPRNPTTTTCAGCSLNRRRSCSAGPSSARLRVATGTPYARARTFGSRLPPCPSSERVVGCRSVCVCRGLRHLARIRVDWGASAWPRVDAGPALGGGPAHRTRERDDGDGATTAARDGGRARARPDRVHGRR